MVKTLSSKHFHDALARTQPGDILGKDSSTSIWQGHELPLGKLASVVTVALALAPLGHFLHQNVMLPNISKPLGNTALGMRLVWFVAFAINLWSVWSPGRFDGRNSPVPWDTIFAPSGWAFAIWGIIFSGEILVTLWVSLFSQALGSASTTRTLMRSVSGWMCANLFQSLWCAAFRPAFINALWLPWSLLALAATSLSFTHLYLTRAIRDLPPVANIFQSTDISGFVRSPLLWNRLGLLALRFPISLHTAWLTAASLLNLNGWAAVQRISLGRQTCLAIVSTTLATILGTVITVRRGDPMIGLTFAWAIAAISSNTQSKNFQVPLSNDTKEALALYEKLSACFLTFISISFPLLRTFHGKN